VAHTSSRPLPGSIQMTDQSVEPTGDDLRRTGLHDLHAAAGARMVDFAGWSMPLHYGSAKDEHVHTRTATSLFDVGHMAVVDLHGPGAAASLERLTPSAVVDLEVGRSRYMVLTNAHGGVIDDLVATRMADDLVRVVVNAARAEVDIAHLEATLGDDVRLEVRRDLGLLAIQGPTAAEALATVGEATDDLVFLDGRPAAAGGDTWLSRSGYTGEDGFELVAPHRVLVDVAATLLELPDVAWAGLAARDSLRLEAGLCLYGNDLDTDTTPIEAGLVWTIPADRRAGGDYPGAEVIARQVAEGPPRRLRGLAVAGRRPVRAGNVVRLDDRDVGVVTSGGWGASLEAPVAMGYVAAEVPLGTDLVADVRGADVAVTTVKLPHVPHRYRR
jgi:aminomethyltransferase